MDVLEKCKTKVTSYKWKKFCRNHGLRNRHSEDITSYLIHMDTKKCNEKAWKHKTRTNWTGFKMCMLHKLLNCLQFDT